MSEVEVFADVWCPFTHVGLRRFVAFRDGSGESMALRVRSWPLELVNSRPLDVDLVAEEIEQLRSVAAPELFTAFDPDAFPKTTLPALHVTARAYRASVATGEAVALELRHRLFEQGEDISDPSVLDAVVRAHGVPVDGDDAEDPVRLDWEQGARRGVIGSPHFFTPGGDFFCPALDVRRIDGHLRITADPAGFDRFLESCRASR